MTVQPARISADETSKDKVNSATRGMFFLLFMIVAFDWNPDEGLTLCPDQQLSEPVCEELKVEDCLLAQVLKSHETFERTLCSSFEEHQPRRQLSNLRGR